jgi:cellulose synthase/poly-beta-1,6-N-acetylglucosamine synthase-like glycosyltransferase
MRPYQHVIKLITEMVESITLYRICGTASTSGHFFGIRISVGSRGMSVMAKQPVFSVIVITHDRLMFLKETLAALQRQTHENLEIIVVNNGSTDGTTEFLEQLEESDERVSLVNFEENQWSANAYLLSGAGSIWT